MHGDGEVHLCGTFSIDDMDLGSEDMDMEDMDSDELMAAYGDMYARQSGTMVDGALTHTLCRSSSSGEEGGAGKALRATPFGEFSATPLPGSDSDYSVVRVEADGTQRLWQISTQAEQLLYPELKGVGYHVWGSDQDIRNRTATTTYYFTWPCIPK